MSCVKGIKTYIVFLTFFFPETFTGGSLFALIVHTNGPSSEIKMARSGCEIKMTALKAPSSWSSQNQPYGPLRLVLFLHSVLSNMLGEIRVQPACLSAETSAELWFTTGIHPCSSHSNRQSAMCSVWSGQGALLLDAALFYLNPTGSWWDTVYMHKYTHSDHSDIWCLWLMGEKRKDDQLLFLNCNLK